MCVSSVRARADWTRHEGQRPDRVEPAVELFGTHGARCAGPCYKSHCRLEWTVLPRPKLRLYCFGGTQVHMSKAVVVFATACTVVEMVAMKNPYDFLANGSWDVVCGLSRC